MRAPPAILAMLIIAACGGKATPPATVGNTGGPAPPRPGHGITVTATDMTGGAHERAIKGTAEQHVAVLAHGNDVDALAIEVTLMSIDVGAEIECHIRITVTTARDRALLASLTSTAKVVTSGDADRATSDCIDGVVGSLIDHQLAQFVDERIAERGAPAP